MRKEKGKDQKVRCKWDLKSDAGHLRNKSVKILKKKIVSNFVQDPMNKV